MKSFVPWVLNPHKIHTCRNDDTPPNRRFDFRAGRVIQFLAARRAVHKTILSFLAVLFVFSGCVSFPVSSSGSILKIPLTQNGAMSDVTLALVKRQNIIRSNERTYIHPDGLAFYFVISPRGNHLFPAIKEAQNFTIDGKAYWQNQAGSIDSHTVIYSPKTFAHDDPDAAGTIGLAEDSDKFIQKTIICGEPLPSEGIVRYPFYFGFEQELEEFEFLFRLQDVL